MVDNTNGYTLSRTKGKKGYPIEKIDPNSPAVKSWIKSWRFNCKGQWTKD